MISKHVVERGKPSSPTVQCCFHEKAIRGSNAQKGGPTDREAGLAGRALVSALRFPSFVTRDV